MGVAASSQSRNRDLSFIDMNAGRHFNWGMAW